MTLGEYPILRYDDKGIPARTSGTIAHMLATAVQEKLDQAYKDDPENFVRGPTAASAAGHCARAQA